MSTEDQAIEDVKEPALLTVLAPYLIITICLAVVLSVGLIKWLSKTEVLSTQSVVVFDVLKYVNSQRAIASNLLNPSKQDDTALFMRDISSRTQAAIAEVAGENTVVLVKQSVVSLKHTRDITDDVLRKLNMPTDVPTLELNLSDDVTTHLSLSPEMKQEALRFKENNPKATEKGKDSRAVLP